MKCSHFSWLQSSSSGFGNCSFKSGRVSKKNATENKNEKAYCGLAIEWNGGRFSEKCEFLGEAYKLMESENSRLCGYQCRQEPHCTHFTWENNTCYLKHNKSISENDAYANEYVRCGIKAKIFAESIGKFFQITTQFIVIGLMIYIL